MSTPAWRRENPLISSRWYKAQRERIRADPAKAEQYREKHRLRNLKYYYAKKLRDGAAKADGDADK